MEIIRHRDGYLFLTHFGDFEIAEIHHRPFGLIWDVKTGKEHYGDPIVGICFWRFHFLNLLQFFWRVLDA